MGDCWQNISVIVSARPFSITLIFYDLFFNPWLQPFKKYCVAK